MSRHQGCAPDCEGCGCGNPGAMPPCWHCTDCDPDVVWEEPDAPTDNAAMALIHLLRVFALDRQRLARYIDNQNAKHLRIP